MRNHHLSRIALTATVMLLAVTPAVVSAREYDFVISSISLTLPPAIVATFQPIGITCELFLGGSVQLAEATTPISLTNGTYNASNVRVVVNYAATSSSNTANSYSCWLSGAGPGNPYANLLPLIQQHGTGDAKVTTSNNYISGSL
jgi:hypothetical protein